MRDITKVIDDIKSKVPVDLPEMIGQLDNILTSVPYTAPEAILHLWARLQSVMSVFAPLPLRHDWQVHAVAVYTTKTVDEVRAEFFQATPFPKMTKVLSGTSDVKQSNGMIEDDPGVLIPIRKE